MNNKNEFITTDLHLATAFMTAGLKVLDVRINQQNGKTSGVFIIDKTERNIDKISKDYYNGLFPVDAYTYRNNLKRLKTWAMSVMAQKGAYK